MQSRFAFAMLLAALSSGGGCVMGPPPGSMPGHAAGGYACEDGNGGSPGAINLDHLVDQAGCAPGLAGAGIIHGSYGPSDRPPPVPDPGPPGRFFPLPTRPVFSPQPMTEPSYGGGPLILPPAAY